jgi:hypothetical protein
MRKYKSTPVLRLVLLYSLLYTLLSLIMALLSAHFRLRDKAVRDTYLPMSFQSFRAIKSDVGSYAHVLWEDGSLGKVIRIWLLLHNISRRSQSRW